MKHQALTSIKFLKLKRALRLPSWQAVGLLESLWLATQSNAMDGGIGRFTDEDIAAMIEWQDDPKILIEALINCGWIDRHPDDKIRLAIHDWHDHAPRFVKGNLGGRSVDFASRICDPHKQAAYAPPISDPHQQAPPNQTKPNQTKPNQTKGGCGGKGSQPVECAPVDPLDDYPILQAALPDILAGVLQRHGASTLPDTPKRELEWRTELANTVRLDGHQEREVAAALVWCLFEEEPRGDFAWFKQFRSIPRLRTRNSADDPRKIEQIIAAWREQAVPCGAMLPPPREPTDEELAELPDPRERRSPAYGRRARGLAPDIAATDGAGNGSRALAAGEMPTQAHEDMPEQALNTPGGL